MDNIIHSITTNLINVGIGVGVFVTAYLSNMFLGIWLNVGILDNKFSWDKICQSFIKILCVGFGIVFLTLSITLVTPFALENGLQLPSEYSEVINVVATLTITLQATLKYIKESFTKLHDILKV